MSMITLKQALARWDQETGSSLRSSYSTLTKHARRGFDVLGTNPIKTRNRWLIDEEELARSIAAEQERLRQVGQNTEDYERHILHPGERTEWGVKSTQTVWGSYTVYAHYHTRYDSHAAAYDHIKRRGYYTDAVICNTCWQPCDQEYGPDREECHVCSDWGGCGTNCTQGPLLSTSCPRCGWTEYPA